MGGVADYLIISGLSALAMPVLNLGFGVSAVLIGYAMAIPRFLDAFLDPLMGNISDNTRSRWGRRRPYILAGSLGCGLLFPLLFCPPFTSQNGIFLWFLGISILYYITYSVFIVPYNALGYELTQDYHERTQVQGWRMTCALVIGFSIPWLYKFTLHPAFGGDERIGVRYVGAGLGLFIILAGAIPALFTHENVAVQKQEKIELLKSIAFTFQNRSFLLLTASGMLIKAGLFMAGPLGLYLNLYYVCAGDKSMAATMMGLAGLLTTLGCLGGVWLSTKTSLLLGKRHAASLNMVFCGLAFLSSWWLFTPVHPYWQLIFAFAIGLGLQGCWLLLSSMVADVCDEDELKTGLRREGMFGAVSSFAEKCALAAGNLIGGYLLVFSGAQEGLAQSSETIFNLRLSYAGVQTGLIVVSFVLILLYPLSHQRVEEVRALIQKRKQAQSCRGDGESALPGAVLLPEAS